LEEETNEEFPRMLCDIRKSQQFLADKFDAFEKIVANLITENNKIVLNRNRKLKICLLNSIIINKNFWRSSKSGEHQTRNSLREN
jgi:hypothetical protein